MRAHEIGFFGGLFFVGGILISNLSFPFYVVICMTAICAAACLLRWSVLWSVLMGCVFFGAFFYAHFYTAWHAEHIPYDDRVSFMGTVSEIPKIISEGQTFEVALGDPYKGSVTLIVSEYPRVRIGDELSFEGKIERGKQGERHFVRPDSFSVVGRNDSLLSMLFVMRERIKAGVERVLPSEHAALLAGILLGERADFSDEFYDALVRSGTVHIVALSGYNISVIATGIITVCAYMVGRRKALYVASGGIVLFVLMTGSAESVVRAACMGILILCAESLGRVYSFRNAIVLTAAFMLMWDPEYITHTGFQLSFLALIGIVYGEPLLRRIVPHSEGDGVLGWKKNLFQTAAAQIAVLPVLLVTFGTVSFVSLFANVLILSAIPVTMFVGGIMVVSGCISFQLSLMVGWLTYVLLSYEILVIRFLGA